MTVIQKYAWHLRRLVPWRLVMNQPDVADLTFNPDGIDTDDKNMRGMARFASITSESPMGRTMRARIVGRKPGEWNAFINELQVNTDATLNMSPADLRGMFATVGASGDYPTLSGTIYATVNRFNVITNLTFYVFKK